MTVRVVPAPTRPGTGAARVTADRDRGRALEDEGAEVSGRDLPGSLKVSLHDLLEEP